jgi:hypothetical protein
MKYLHKFYNKHDVPWVQLLWNSYYNGKIPHAMDPCGSFWWRDVLKLAPLYRGIARCQVKDGTSVLFWKDPWIDSVVHEDFHRAFSYCRNEDISVQDFITAPTLSDNFYLPLSPKAFDEIREMRNRVHNLDLDSQQHDLWSYILGNSNFSPSKYYNFCFREIEPHPSFNWIWKAKNTAKLKLFCWLLSSHRLNYSFKNRTGE